MRRRIERAAELSAVAYGLRCYVIEMIHRAGSGHAGGSLSAAEIVALLYWDEMRVDPAQPRWPGRDRLVLSKGHCAPIVYAALARRGYFDPELLTTFRQTGSILQGHPDVRKTPGLDMTSGSLGQGLSVGLGMALAARQSGDAFRVFVLMSDGEMQEGMTWEAAMAAHHFRTGNLTAIVDRNNLQVDGWVNEVMDVEPLAAKWRAFGWRVISVDGHDVAALRAAFSARARLDAGQPAAILCRTTKGRGVSFMEDAMEWHGGTLTDDQYLQALSELRPKAGLANGR